MFFVVVLVRCGLKNLMFEKKRLSPKMKQSPYLERMALVFPGYWVTLSKRPSTPN